MPARAQIMCITGLALHRPIQHFGPLARTCSPVCLLATARKKTAAAGKIVIAADSYRLPFGIVAGLSGCLRVVAMSSLDRRRFSQEKMRPPMTS
jgi:hypothetical protein